MKCYSHRISHPNINSRWVVVLNVKVLLEDSMWKYLSDLKWWKGIFKTKVKAIIIKKNIYKLDYIKIKKFCLSKERWTFLICRKCCLPCFFFISSFILFFYYFNTYVYVCLDAYPEYIKNSYKSVKKKKKKDKITQ